MGFGWRSTRTGNLLRMFPPTAKSNAGRHTWRARPDLMYQAKDGPPLWDPNVLQIASGLPQRFAILFRVAARIPCAIVPAEGTDNGLQHWYLTVFGTPVQDVGHNQVLNFLLNSYRQFDRFTEHFRVPKGGRSLDLRVGDYWDKRGFAECGITTAAPRDTTTLRWCDRWPLWRTGTVCALSAARVTRSALCTAFAATCSTRGSRSHWTSSCKMRHGGIPPTWCPCLTLSTTPYVYALVHWGYPTSCARTVQRTGLRRILVGACQGLAHLNQKLDLLHCDIKPMNVFVHVDESGLPSGIIGDIDDVIVKVPNGPRVSGNYLLSSPNYETASLSVHGTPHEKKIKPQRNRKPATVPWWYVTFPVAANRTPE